MHLQWSNVLLASAVAASTSYGQSCQDISICLDSKALNTQFPTLFSKSDDLYISATFCEPSTYVGSRRNTLQILLHGAAYTRTYWSSLGLNIDIYNWVLYAGRRGFPTLSIDRLCNGASSRPPGTSCTIPSEAAVLHQLVQQARAGRLPLGKSTRSFKKIIPVGHSVGGDICNYNAEPNPSDADALVLTGWSSKLARGVPTVTFGLITPAAVVYPDRFGSLGPDYLTFASETGQRYLSYYGDYDPKLAHYDYTTQGTFTIGEGTTALDSQRASPSFNGATFLLVGNEDPTYCQGSDTSAFTMSIGNCSAGIASGTREFFPSVKAYGYAVIPNTGHNVNLHLTAQRAYKTVFDFLATQGF